MDRILALLALAALLVPPGLAFGESDPPGRVGRISLLQGEVTFRNTSTGESEPAALNWPITNQAALATGPHSRAEVQVGSSIVRIDGDSEVEFAALDDERIHVRLLDGTTSVRLRNRDQLAGFEITTPHGRVTLQDVGRYRIDDGDASNATVITAHEGAARFESAEGSVTVPPGKRAEIWGDNGLQFRIADASRDEFDDWTLGRDRRDDAPQAGRYVSPEMTGYEDLDAYGDWRDVPEYGPVWMPRAVATDWAPYRSGRWAWVEPWGWTWVDYAPWGFTPFHYGRWVIVSGAWGWVPGLYVRRPVYAPALVAWIGRPGWSVVVSSTTVPAVGWFPLGPREVYYPGYHCTTNYVRNVNVTHVTNVTTINVTNVDVTKVNYVHRNVVRAVTVVPQHVVANGRPVAPATIAVRDRRELAAVPVATAVPDASITPQRRNAEVRREERATNNARERATWRWQTGAQPLAPNERSHITVPLQQSAPVIAPRSDDRPGVATQQSPRVGSQPQRQDVERSRPEVPRAAAPQPLVPQHSTPHAVAPRPEPPRTPAPQVVAPLQPSAPHGPTLRPEAPSVVVPKAPTPQAAGPQVSTPHVVVPRPEPARIVAPQVVTPQPAYARPGTSRGEERSHGQAPRPEGQRSAPPHSQSPRSRAEMQRYEQRGRERDHGSRVEARGEGGGPQTR